MTARSSSIAVRIGGVVVLLVALLLVANGVGALWTAVSSNDAYAPFGFVIGPISLLLGLVAGLVGIGVLRHRTGGRVGGLFIGGVLVVGGLIAGYVAVETWLRANNAPPEISYPAETVSFGLNDLAVAVPLLIAGAYLIWALGTRWFTRTGTSPPVPPEALPLEHP